MERLIGIGNWHSVPYGMLGVSLFGSAYGLEEIGYIAVMDLGHELFIWFVFLAFLLAQRDGVQETGH